jgi:hypothetical protein
VGKIKDLLPYFEHNGEYYNYNYSSVTRNYDSHYEDAMAILIVLNFKMKSGFEPIIVIIRMYFFNGVTQNQIIIIIHQDGINSNYILL